MAVKRAVGRSVSVEGAAHGAVMKELGGAEVRSHGAAAQPGHKPAPQGTGQRSAPSVSDMIGKGVKSWTELMESLSPKVEEPLPEMTKADDDAFVDDLPLGSEANTLSAVVSTASTTAVPPLDPRLSSLKAAGHYGWASFNSEVSGQTSGSSANSLDILLSQRNVDPEQMLRSLGFGFANEQEAPMLRVPVRFMQKSHANGINIAEFLAEYPELQQVMMKKSGKWGSVSRSISTMLAMKSFLGQTTTAASPPSSNNNITATPESGHPDAESGPPQHVVHPSILSLENQRALASQGYYDSNTPNAVAQAGKQETAAETVQMRKPMDAATRRERFQKTRSTKRWSMVESSEDPVGNVESGEVWISRSLDESKGRHSGTDFSSSMDSSDSPANDSRTSSISEKRRIFELEMMKRSGEDLGSISRNREHQVNILMDDDDEDGNYLVSGGPSKQSTIEKRESVVEAGSDRNDVKIVVSDTDPSARDVTDSGSIIPKSANGTHSLLTIVNAQLERLSDSGSDYTLVESPRPSTDVEVSHPVLMQTLSKDSVFEESDKTDKSVSVSCQTSFDIHKLDENDNLSSAKVKSVIDDVKHSQDDLTRMGSVQSDSSGFGDADNTADIPAPENERAWVASLGSSSESAGTLASSNTTVLVHDVVTDMATQTSLSEQARHVTAMELTVPRDPNLNSFRRTFGENVQPNGDLSSRYISTYYIPPLSKASPSSIVKGESGTKVSGQSLVLGKTRVSVIVPNKSQKSIEIQNSSQENKSQVKTVHTRQEVHVSPYYEIRAPLAKPEEFESEEDHRESDHFPHFTRRGIRHVSELSRVENVEHTSAVSVLNLSVADSGEFGSRISLAEDDSDYSCSSVADSTASCSSSEIFHYKKLARLINQPVTYRGHPRRRSFTRYRPKRPIKDWPNLVRKKRVQEETRLLQHSLQTYKAELQVMETSCLLQYQLAYEDISEDEREEVEELQMLWRELKEQIYNMEQLLAHRMKAVTKGSDFFTFLSTLNVIQTMTELMKEQMYQQTVSPSLEQEREEEQEEEEMEEEREAQASFTHSSPFLPPSPLTSYSSVFGIPGNGPPESIPQHSLDEMRRSLLEEMREEMNRSTQQLNLDMQARDNEIQRLNLQLMMQSHWPPLRSRSTHSLPHRRSTRQTDV
ncbi:protein ITPRID2-like isoform X2 [Haliotis asinina]